jgi:hypothetical protein
VVSVTNELEIAGLSSYTSRSNDALITTKVKASLVDMKTISANSFKVVTERGAVYLMGRVTQREGQIGADVARGVSGVTKVVKVFEYITEEWKLKAHAVHLHATAHCKPATSCPPPHSRSRAWIKPVIAAARCWLAHRRRRLCHADASRQRAGSDLYQRSRATRSAPATCAARW